MGRSLSVTIVVVATLLGQVDGVAAAPSQTAKTGLCVKIAKRDLKVSDAVVIVGSGDPDRDRRLRDEAIGVQTPTPVAWNSDFWISMWVGDFKEADGETLKEPLPNIDCRALNRQLCRQDECRVRWPRPRRHTK